MFHVYYCTDYIHETFKDLKMRKVKSHVTELSHESFKGLSVKEMKSQVWAFSAISQIQIIVSCLMLTENVFLIMMLFVYLISFV